MTSKPVSSVWPISSLLLAATLWGVFWYPLRLLEQAGLSGLWSAAVIYVGTLPPALVLMRGRWGELAREPAVLLALAVASGVCNVTFILAMLHGEVVRALLLFYLSPVWATLLGRLLLREFISRRAAWVLVLAMAGAVVMLWDPDASLATAAATADVLALVSGLSFALVNTLVRRIQDVSVATKTVAAWSGVTLVAFALLTLSAQPWPSAGSGALTSALLLGVLAMPLMTLSVQYGVSYMPVHRSAVILLFELVAGAISSLWLTDEAMSWREWTGGACVALAALLTVQRQIEADHAKI